MKSLPTKKPKTQKVVPSWTRQPFVRTSLIDPFSGASIPARVRFVPQEKISLSRKGTR